MKIFILTTLILINLVGGIGNMSTDKPAIRFLAGFNLFIAGLLTNELIHVLVGA